MPIQPSEPRPDAEYTQPTRHAQTGDPTRATMQAIVRDAYGSADVLHIRDVARPTAAAGEVLVRVHAAGLDRGAWHFMTGRPYLMRLAGFGVRRPKDPGLGTELAGVVEAVGADVTGFSVGDAVYGQARTPSRNTRRRARASSPASRPT